MTQTDLSQRTDAQLIARLRSQFDAIWRMGDRDECSIKHVGHGAAALIVHGDWQKAIDYNTPWENQNDDRRLGELAKKWDKVRDSFDRIGWERAVKDIVPRTPHGGFIMRYVEDYESDDIMFLERIK